MKTEMKQVYLAHPLKGTPIQESINLSKAKLWYKWACDHYWPDRCFNAMWIINVEVYNDANAVDREKGMRRNYAHIERCDELWLLGFTISSGMEEEALFAESLKMPVYDMTTEGLEPWMAPRFPLETMPLWKAGNLTQQVLGF